MDTLANPVPGRLNRSRYAFTIACCALLVSTVAACSSGSKKADQSSTTPTSSTAPAGSTAADPTTAITNAFITFFDGKAPIPQRLALLQGADAFQSVLANQTTSTIITQTSATVSAVVLMGANQAKVTYTVSLSGTPTLPNQMGGAVRINGTWKVAASTFCSILSLGGAAPAACTDPSVTAVPS
jgi:hypothetical protein